SRRETISKEGDKTMERRPPQPSPRSCLAGRGSGRLQWWWVYQEHAPAQSRLIQERGGDSLSPVVFSLISFEAGTGRPRPGSCAFLNQPCPHRFIRCFPSPGAEKYAILGPMSQSRAAPKLSDAHTAAMGFHTTHWTIVLAARKKDGTVAHEALARLCSTYWYPLYAFIRRQGSSPHEAEDLTQEFFFRFLDRHALGHVQPAAGKFRSFLLACLKNFLANERERAHAQRRGGGQSLVPLTGTDAETRYSLEPADQRTPEAVFERRWAFAVLERTMTELRHEYVTAGKSEFF